MKRIYTALCAAVMIAISGCSGQNAAGFSESDLSLNVSGNTYQCRANIDTVIADLGDGYEYAEGKSCNYDGLDKTYTYDLATFYTNPLADGDLLSEIYTEDGAVTTSKGIAVGATKADVISAYGEPTQQDPAILIYRPSQQIGQPALCFELDGDTVSAIFLTLEQV